MNIEADLIYDPTCILALDLTKKDDAVFRCDDRSGRSCTNLGAKCTPQGMSFDGIYNRIYSGQHTTVPLSAGYSALIWMMVRSLSNTQPVMEKNNILHKFYVTSAGAVQYQYYDGVNWRNLASNEGWVMVNRFFLMGFSVKPVMPTMSGICQVDSRFKISSNTLSNHLQSTAVWNFGYHYTPLFLNGIIASIIMLSRPLSMQEMLTYYEKTRMKYQ